MVFWQQKYECQACASSQIPGACSEISGGISVVNGRQGINLCQRLSEHRFRPEVNPSTTSSYSSSLSSSSSFFYNLFDHFHLHLPVSYVCHHTSILPAPPSTSFSSPLMIMLSKDFVQRSIHPSPPFTPRPHCQLQLHVSLVKTTQRSIHPRLHQK